MSGLRGKPRDALFASKKFVEEGQRRVDAGECEKRLTLHIANCARCVRYAFWALSVHDRCTVRCECKEACL